jgi:hypothetical protein
MMLAAIAAMLAWHPQPRLASHRTEQLAERKGVVRTPMHKQRSIPAMQAGNAAAARAMEMLGKMGMQAASQATPGQIPEVKEFVVPATIVHNRVIEAVDGGAVPDYMRLPVEQYAIYDARLMRKLPKTEDGGDGELFELSVPTMRPREGTFVPKPTIRVRVTPEAERVTLQSVGASIFGGAEGSLPPNVTEEQLRTANERMKEGFDLALNTTLSWSAAKRRSPGATTLKCRTDVRVKLSLPAPFTRAPRPLVQGAIGLVMKFVGNAILPRFAALLEADYQSWANGTRSLTTGLGSLTLDDDGYIVVPEQVLQKMRSAPGGQERLAAAGTTLDIEGRGVSTPVGTPDGDVTSEGSDAVDVEALESADDEAANAPRGTSGRGFGTPKRS